MSKGFYIIVTPEYSIQKILSPDLFIDTLFKYLGRPYYVGLLSASFYHGASHQKPQEYFVIIDKPVAFNSNSRVKNQLHCGFNHKFKRIR